MKLSGKNVLVTGGSKGIGRACVQAFAAQGANVIINFAHDESSAKDCEDAATKLGVKALVVQADITSQDDVDRMFRQIGKQFSSLDVVINNAGGNSSPDVSENLPATVKTFEKNLFAQIRVTNSARKLMATGKIIFVSSIHGRLGHGRPNVIGYSAAKAALESYVKNLAKELAPEILVNAISPGRTLTPLWGDMTEEQIAKQGAGKLIGRMIQPDEIADGVIFLAKNDAVCGEVLVIDGGMSLKTLG